MLFTDVQRSVRLNKKKKSTNTSPYPDEVIDRLARAFYPAILACWNSEEGQRSLVGARPLHLANARPFGRLKAPLGLSLLRCAAQTRTFENALLSAGCKKKQGKLWQKERGLDDAYPLDKAIIVKKFRTHFHPGFVPVCRMPLQSERSRAIMPL